MYYAHMTPLDMQVIQKCNARWTTEEQLLAVQGMGSPSCGLEAVAAFRKRHASPHSHPTTRGSVLGSEWSESTKPQKQIARILRLEVF